MGILDFLFGKAKTVEDAVFGELRFFDAKDENLQYFEGKCHFQPINGMIELSIDAGSSGPTERQRQFFREVEEKYDELVKQVKPLINNEFGRWKENFCDHGFQKRVYAGLRINTPPTPGPNGVGTGF